MVPAAAAVPGSADRILAMLDADGRSAHWREEYGRLTEPERDALGSLLLNIGVRRRASQRDFAGLARLLAEGHALGLTNTPAASQGAEMLSRLAMFADARSLARTA
jgi:hypothetical protein